MKKFALICIVTAIAAFLNSCAEETPATTTTTTTTRQTTVAAPTPPVTQAIRGGGY